MDCVKDPIAAGTTKLYVTYSNKSMSAISEILIQAAVVKTSKLVIDPMNATTLPPMSQ